MTAPETRPHDTATLATYWFAKLAAALDRADFLLASAARDQLRRLGYDVRQSAPPRRRPKGGGA